MKKILLFLLFSILANTVYSQVGINTANPQGVFHIDGASDNPLFAVPTLEQQSNDLIMNTSGSVAIGTISPDPSAILELNVNGLVSGSKKGFLAPQVALTSRTDNTTIPTPATGLMVYNLGTAPTFTYSGYVFWNGTEWRTLDNTSLAEGVIGAITCNSVALTPSTYIAGTPYNGTMNVPYTGGNGGIYGAQTIGPVNGLTATLASGNFANGAGTLSYTVTGTPVVGSPQVTVFPLNIGGATCDATVGAGDGIAPGDLVFYKSTPVLASTSNVWLSDLLAATPGGNDLPIIGGKLQLDCRFTANSNGPNATVSMDPMLVNISSSPVKIWFSAVTTVDRYNAANYLIAAQSPSKSWVNLDNGIYLNYGFNDILGTSTPRTTGSGTGGNQEVVTVDLSLDDKWYRIYYFPIVDNLNTTPVADNVRIIYLSIQRLY